MHLCFLSANFLESFEHIFLLLLFFFINKIKLIIVKVKYQNGYSCGKSASLFLMTIIKRFCFLKMYYLFFFMIKIYSTFDSLKRLFSDIYRHCTIYFLSRKTDKTLRKDLSLIESTIKF